MLKKFGLILITLSLLFTLCWVISPQDYKGWVVTMCIIAIFVGLALILSDRAIEITMGGIGTIKAATKQVVLDAKAIGEIRKEIESHPLFIFGRLPVKAQGLLKRLHLENTVSKKPEAAGGLAYLGIDEEEFGSLFEELGNKLEWIEDKGDEIRLTEKGKKEIGSFIEITIARWA